MQWLLGSVTIYTFGMNSESNFDARMCIAYIIVSCFLLPLCHHKENIITNVGKYNTLNTLFKWLPVMNHTHYRRKIAFAIQFDQKLPCHPFKVVSHSVSKAVNNDSIVARTPSWSKWRARRRSNSHQTVQRYRTQTL